MSNEELENRALSLKLASIDVSTLNGYLSSLNSYEGFLRSRGEGLSSFPVQQRSLEMFLACANSAQSATTLAVAF